MTHPRRGYDDAPMHRALTRDLADDLDRAVIVAVVAVRVVQACIPFGIDHEVVDMIAVRDGFMAAAGAADVIGAV